MIKDLTNLTKKPSHSKAEQLMSMGGGMMLLRKGVTKPGIIGVVSLAIGAFTLYRGIKAYRANHNDAHGNASMATRAGATSSTPQTAGAATTPATPVKSPLG